MSARHDTFRFFLPVIFGCAAAAGIGVRLVYLHLDLVSTKPRQPKYDFTRNIQGRRGTIYGANGAALSQTKAVDSLLISGIAAQMKTADPLDRDDPAVKNGSARSCNGIPAPEGVSTIISISSTFF